MIDIQTALLVDCNDFDDFINHRLLQSHGVSHIISFHNVDSALEYLQGTKVIYQIIIVDMDTADVNGQEFIERFFNLELEKIQGKIYTLSSSLNCTLNFKSETHTVQTLQKPLTIEQLTGRTESQR
jgi:two-component SAPR family response regulator